VRKEADSARAEKGALGVGEQGRQGAAGTKCTPRKKFAQGSAQGSAQVVLYEEGRGKRTWMAGGEDGRRREETGGWRRRLKEGRTKFLEGCSGIPAGNQKEDTAGS